MSPTDKAIKAIEPTDKPTCYYDTEGSISKCPRPGKWWRPKYRIAGKEKWISLRVYPTVSLKEAREKRDEAKRSLAKGIDPSFQKKRFLAQQRQTFEVVARKWMDTRVDAVTAKTWVNNENRMRRFIYPFIGTASIKDLIPPDTLVRRAVKSGSRSTVIIAV